MQLFLKNFLFENIQIFILLFLIFEIFNESKLIFNKFWYEYKNAEISKLLQLWLEIYHDKDISTHFFEDQNDEISQKWRRKLKMTKFLEMLKLWKH